MAQHRRLLSRVDRGIFVVLAICLIATWPFLSRPSLPQETDTELHVFRLHELSLLVQGGEWYPRWAPNFYHGYGYPIFNYYAPLSYYLGLPVTLLPWFDAVDGVKFVFLLSLLAAALGMYGFVRAKWGRTAGYVAAAAYLYSPYVQYIDPHARGALAEALALGIFPLALWALNRLRDRPSPGSFVAAALLTSAVILSHNLMALLFFALLVGWVAWQWIWDSFARRRALKKPFAAAPDFTNPGSNSRGHLVALALLLGLGLAAFFWLPVILERGAVNLNTLIGRGDNYDFHTHFLSIKELLSPSKLLDWSDSEPAFLLNLGIPQWVLGLAGGALAVAGRPRERGQMMFFLVVAIMMVFLMLPVSAPVWERIPVLPYFQFPWRLLGAVAAALSVLAGAASTTIINKLRTREPGAGEAVRRWLAMPSFAALGLTLLPILFGLPLSQPPSWPDFGEVSTLRMSLIEHDGRWLGTTSTSDYVPSTVEVIPERNGAVVQGFYEGKPPERVNRAQGMLPEGTRLDAETVRPLWTRYRVQSPADFLLRLFIFDFPGWTVSVDGNVVETELGRPEGFIVVPVSAGDHVVDVRFGSTPARRLASTISLLSALAAAAVALWLAVGGRVKLGLLEGRFEAAGNSNLQDKLDIQVAMAVLTVSAVHLLLVQPLGWLRYESPRLVAEPAEHDVFVDLGGQMALIGYDVSDKRVAPGEPVKVTLYWQAETRMAINFQVFVHLLDSQGGLEAQSDKLNPGDFPTRRWPLDKYVRDEHVIKIPITLPAGTYQMTAGMWVQQEGWRLPVLDTDGQQAGDKIKLFDVTVVEK